MNVDIWKQGLWYARFKIRTELTLQFDAHYDTFIKPLTATHLVNTRAFDIAVPIATDVS